ncbi:MAG: Hsp20/alpha crystallin family protein [Oscillospiraceae bacterium]
MYGMTPFEKTTFNLFNAFHDFENDFLNKPSVSSCKTDIKEEDNKYILEAELPGFEKEEIKLDLDGDKLVISAEHSEKKDEKDENNKYIRRERTYESYKRSFDVSSVDTSRIDAEYKNGILILTLPKKQPDTPVTRRLEIR